LILEDHGRDVTVQGERRIRYDLKAAKQDSFMLKVKSCDQLAIRPSLSKIARKKPCRVTISSTSITDAMG
jgi:hypothetical protein